MMSGKSGRHLHLVRGADYLAICYLCSNPCQDDVGDTGRVPLCERCSVDLKDALERHPAGGKP